MRGVISFFGEPMSQIRRSLLAASIIAAQLLAAAPVMAGPAADALSACLADNTSGKDRKDMARWVYAGMSTHPEIATLSSVSDKDREALDVTMAAIFTRLITEKCPAQAKATVEKEGNAGFEAAFGMLGKLAMQELMSNQSVNASFRNFTKHLDQKKFSTIFPN